MMGLGLSRQARIHAERELYSGGVSIHLMDEGNQGQLFVAQPVVMKAEEEAYARRLDPMVTLPMALAQQLMDELWNCGLRPTEGTGSAGSLAATERHLADMKALAFHALKVPRG
jgi:hypothetical protein